MKTRLVVPTTALIFLLVGCGGGDGGPSGAETPGAEQTAPEATAQVSRADPKTCLADAGLGPEDSGIFIIGSAGTNVEALGVRLEAGRTLLYVFDDVESASSQAEFAVDQGGYQEGTATGNVAIAFEFAPSQSERDQLDACITG